MATENPQAGCNAIVEILRERQLALPFVKPFKWQGEVWPGKYVCRFEKRVHAAAAQRALQACGYTGLYITPNVYRRAFELTVTAPAA